MTDLRHTKIEILAVGSELLTPYYLDTNSLFLTRHLNRLGMQVAFKSVVGDRPEDLKSCIRVASERSDLILIMGGLGPTQDDRTRESLASALGRQLIFREALWEQIEERFRKRGLSISQVNRRQACVIEGAEPLENPHGTAPGSWLEYEGRTFVLLPGPPREIQPMFLSLVLPRLEEKREGFQVRKILKIVGLTESRTEELISDAYPDTESDIDLTVLASPGQIEIHLTAFSSRSEDDAEAKLAGPVEAIAGRLGRNVFARSEEELEDVIGRLLRENRSTLATAESCTGGLLGHRITNVPGSSDYFLEGVQAYSNQAKTRLLDVPVSLLESHGAVSPQVAAAMAENVRVDSGATLGLGITGIAGPGGGTVEKPVGLVYIAVAGMGATRTEKNLFLGDRETIKRRASQKALDMLRRRLLRIERDPG